MMTKAAGSRLANPRAAAGLILALAVATIGGAWLFQAAGYAPCELCLQERIPYYVGIVVAALTTLAAFVRPGWTKAGFVLLVVIFAASAGFGVYHAGVEWGFWPGPTDCTGTLDKAGSVNDFLKQLQTVKVVRCDAVAIRILGLSLAGWNGVISLGLAGVALVALRTRRMAAAL